MIDTSIKNGEISVCMPLKLKEAIIKGTHPLHLRLADLMNNVPILWNEQE